MHACILPTNNEKKKLQTSLANILCNDLRHSRSIRLPNERKRSVRACAHELKIFKMRWWSKWIWKDAERARNATTKRKKNEEKSAEIIRRLGRKILLKLSWYYCEARDAIVLCRLCRAHTDSHTSTERWKKKWNEMKLSKETSYLCVARHHHSLSIPSLPLSSSFLVRKRWILWILCVRIIMNENIVFFRRERSQRRRAKGWSELDEWIGQIQRMSEERTIQWANHLRRRATESARNNF